MNRPNELSTKDTKSTKNFCNTIISIVALVPKLQLSSLYTSILKHVIPAGIHSGLSCPEPFGSMQIRSRRICAGIQKPWMAIPKQTASVTWGLLCKIKRSHPCALGNCSMHCSRLLFQDVGRNKTIQARSARWRFRRIWGCLPETPVLAIARTGLFRPTSSESCEAWEPAKHQHGDH